VKKVLPALAVVLIATIGGSSAAQAALVDFGIVATGGTLSYTGATLDKSVAFSLDSSTLTVSSTPTDDSGLVQGDAVHFSPFPTNIMYGPVAGGSVDLVKTWTATTGPNAGDVFTETLDTVALITRGGGAGGKFATIGVTLTGTLSDVNKLFVDTPASLTLSANQNGGPGTAITLSLTNFAQTSVIPEPSTWVMMALGFAGLCYAAVRRSSQDRSALAL
jgi:PEP-CTERM motif